MAGLVPAIHVLALPFGMSDLHLVLGIDAAWTPNGSSGIALLRMTTRGSSIVACAPSYSSFLNLADGQPCNWEIPEHGPPNIPALLAAAARLGGKPVDVVAIDMPVAKTQITARRYADDAVSRTFGKYCAAVHCPGRTRPGAFGHQITRDLIRSGFEIATASSPVGRVPALIEVYPLAAVTMLLRLQKRPLYKVGKLTKYLPESDPEGRLSHLFSVWSDIVQALERDGLETGWEMPVRPTKPVMSRMKAFEDALDAIVCAWIGSRYLMRSATPYGDDNGAIWIPNTDTD